MYWLTFCWYFTGLVLLIGSSFNALKVKYGTPEVSYLDLPWTLSAALQMGYGPRSSTMVEAGFDRDLQVQLVSWLQDPRFFLLYDTQGTIAGLRIGFKTTDICRKIFKVGNPETMSFTSKLKLKGLYLRRNARQLLNGLSANFQSSSIKASEDEVAAKMKKLDETYKYTFPSSMYKTSNVWDTDIWHTTVLFTSPESLKKGGRPNLVKGKDEIVTSLFYWADSKWKEAPLSKGDVPTDLKPQGCVPRIGKHYYFNTDQSTQCGDWQGFFVTYDQGILSGFGVSVFGSFRSTYFTPTYYEYPVLQTVQTMLPNRPACVEEWFPLTGLTSVHVFLRSDVTQITCPD